MTTIILSEGTMRHDDVVAACSRALGVLHKAGHVDPYGWTYVASRLHHARTGKDTETQAWNLHEAWDRLEELADIAGYDFGTHPDDPACIGLWDREADEC